MALEDVEGSAQQPRPRHLGLVIPFALIGLAGGWVICGLCGPHFDRVWVPGPLVLLLPAVAGAWLGALVMRTGRPAIRRLFLQVPVAGLVIGALVGLLDDATLCPFPIFGPFAAPAYGVFGGVLSLLFLVPLPIVAAVHGPSARSRPGSIIHSATKRAVWVTTAAAICALTVLPLLPSTHGEMWPIATGILTAGGVVLAALLVIDGQQMRDLRRLAARKTTMRTTAGAPAETLDYGVGDDEVEELEPAASAYRSADLVGRVHLGDPHEARKHVAGCTVRTTLALVAVLGALAWESHRATPPEAPRESLGMYCAKA
jgi:hypothetical protein